MALRNDERASYQLDAKFQESYLSKVVNLLQCELVEGAVSNKDAEDTGTGVAEAGTDPDEMEEGELPDNHGSFGFSIVVALCCDWIQEVMIVFISRFLV